MGSLKLAVKISKMTTLRISSCLLASSTPIYRPFCSSSLSDHWYSNFKELLAEIPLSIHPKVTNLQTPNSQNHQNSTFVSKSLKDDPILQKPISQNHQDSAFDSDSDVVSVLLSLKHQPLSALEYYKSYWRNMEQRCFFEQRPFVNGVDSFCVMFLILAGSESPTYEAELESLIRFYHAYPDDSTTFQKLIEWAKRLSFHLNASVLKCFMHEFTLSVLGTKSRCVIDFDRAPRTLDNAIACFNYMVDEFGADLSPTFARFLFRMMLDRDKDVEELFDKMISRGISWDTGIVLEVMKGHVESWNYEKAEKLFAKARDSGCELDANTYCFAVDLVSRKGDLMAAYELLREMTEKGLVPSTSTFARLYTAFMWRGKKEEALMLKDEITSCWKTMDVAVATYLMKGFYDLGKWESVLALFTRMFEEGSDPEMLAFLIVIKGYCEKGDLEKACELHSQMIEKHIQKSCYIPRLSIPEERFYYITFLLIERLLDAKLWERAFECLVNMAGYDVIRVNSYNLLVSWLCAQGKVDQAKQLCDKIVKSGQTDCRVLLKDNAVVYTILMDGYFKKGDMDKAFKVLDEMVSRRIDCIACTYNTIIHGVCYNGQTSRARKMMEFFVGMGKFKPSFATYSCIIDGFTEEGDLDSASFVSTELSKTGLSARVKMCARKNGGPNKSLRHIDSLRHSSIYSELHISVYETIIYGLCRRRMMQPAFKVFSEVIDAGLLPSQFILKCMIRGYQMLNETEWHDKNYFSEELDKEAGCYPSH